MSCRGRVPSKTVATSPAIEVRHPRESIVSGVPTVLTGQIIEGLRSALDYMVFELSRRNYPDLDERLPQFVLCWRGIEI